MVISLARWGCGPAWFIRKKLKLNPKSPPACFPSNRAIVRSPAQAGRALRVRGGTEPDQPGKWQAARRCYRKRTWARYCLAGSRGSELGCEWNSATLGLLASMGWTIRKSRGGASAADRGGAGLLLPDFPASLQRAWLGARCCSGVQRRGARTSDPLH